MKGKAGFTRTTDLARVAIEATEASLDGDPDAAALATVLAAELVAFGADGTPGQRERLYAAARAALADATSVPAWVPVPAKALDRARYVKARAERALAAGRDEEAIARDVLAAIRWAWGVSSAEARAVVTDKRVRLAILKADADAVTRAALRAAGVLFDRNVLNADAQAARRSR